MIYWDLRLNKPIITLIIVTNVNYDKLNNNHVHSDIQSNTVTPDQHIRVDNMINSSNEKDNAPHLNNVDKDKNGKFSFWLGLFKKAFALKKRIKLLMNTGISLLIFSFR